MSPISESGRAAARRLVGAMPAPLQQRVRGWYAAARHRLDTPAAPAATDNLAYNRHIWDWYAGRWGDPEFRRQHLAYEGRPDEDPETLTHLGDEWGRPADVRAVVDEWISPEVGPTSVVGEIGTGGARVATLVAPAVGEFHGFDIAPRMLERARRELQHVPHTRWHLLDGPRLPDELAGSFDFLYSFDVFVHLDLHVQWRYFAEFARMLRPGGRAFVHTANLTSDAGWERFAAQEVYRVEGFYFTTPESVRTLARRAGLDVVREKGNAPGNFYDERDYLVLVENPVPA